MGMGCVCVAGAGEGQMRSIAQSDCRRNVIRGEKEKSIAQRDCRQNVAGFLKRTLATCVQIPCQMGHIWMV